jgi:LPS-assembly protein
MFFRGYSWGILFAMLFWASSTFAADRPVLGGSDLPYHIKADSLSYDDATKTYRARGRVTITRGDRSLQAEAVDLNEETMEAEAWGNVHFTSGKDWLTGTRVKMNLDAGTGTLYDGILFIREGHFYITGGRIEKTGKDSYYINDGRLTTCDGDSPAWKITGKDLKVTIDGYGTVKHAGFWAKSVPFLYVPFLVFPAKIRRQTGLLVPQASLSDRDGFTYNQPLFWAINESSDATFYGSYMERRGFKPGVEYRYVLAPGSKGTAMFDYLRDRQIDDGTIPEDTSGYHYEGFRGDDEDRLNKDRWWFRMKSDQDLGDGFRAKLDMDLVSDQDYLREFRSGYSGYDGSDAHFYEEFGRDVDDYTDTVRLNQLSLNRNWALYSFITDLRWYDDVIARKNDHPNPRLQRLPHVQFDGSRQKLSSSPLYFDLESSYDHFWRELGTRGHRGDLHPRVYYPMEFSRFLDFEPSVGLRETLWQVDKYEDDTPEKEDRFLSRETFDCRADLSTEFWRTFNLEGDSVDKIRHTVRPRVIYDYVSVPDQEDLPNFDNIDRLVEKNLITYSITNYFIARSTGRHEPESKTDPESPERPDSPPHTYRDLCRLKFSQSYDIIEARRDEANGSRTPFSDIKAELEFRPYGCLDLKGDLTWSPYDSDFTSHNVILMVCDKRGDRGVVDYRYTQEESHSIVAKALVKLFGPASVFGERERNLEDGEDVRTVVGFKYESQCWSLHTSYTDDRTMDTQAFFVEIGLYGIGKIGL